MHDENHQPCALRVSGKIEALWQMMRIRSFEQAALNCYNCGYMGGLLVLSIGQESVAVAVRMAMAEVDQSICGVRGLHHALASGLSMRAMMAELFGKCAEKRRTRLRTHKGGALWRMWLDRVGWHMAAWCV